MTTQSSYPVAVRFGSLSDFLAEVPAGAAVRVSLTRSESQALTTFALSVQALNAEGQILWLQEAHEVMYAGSQPVGARDVSIVKEMHTLHDDLCHFLEGQGFQVREGSDYALPRDLKPLQGQVGAWTRNPESEAYSVKLAVPGTTG